MKKNFERVVLLKDLKDTSFKKGDAGTVELIHPDSGEYIVKI